MILAALLLSTPANVPAGTLRLGSGRSPDERPVREVTLSPYRIDRTEVSIAAFESWVARGGYTEKKSWSVEGLDWLRDHPEGAGAAVRASGRTGDHPVVAVTWWEADAYCRAHGGMLPSEAQWERASCAEAGRYPWGESEDFAAVWYKEGKFGLIDSVQTEPVEKQDPSLASPFGLLHAAGNVWEWTADSYDARWYAEAPSTDPVNTNPRPWRTLRGGSYANLPSYCTCTHREPARPSDVRLTVGFRCAGPPA